MVEWSAIYKESKDANLEEIEKQHMHHNMHQLIFIVEGEMKLTTMGKEYTARKGSIIFISNIEMHCVKEIKYPYRRYVIYVPETFIQNIQLTRELTSIFYSRSSDFMHCVSVPEIKDKLTVYFDELVKESKRRHDKSNKYADEVAASYLTLILITLFRNRPDIFPAPLKEIDSTIYKVKEYIDNNFSKEILISDLACMFYLSQSYLCQYFKNLTGYSPKKYIILCRIAAARAHLYNSEKAIGEIAEIVGFSDTNNFIRYFKKETGTTPFQFRKSLRDNASSIN